MSSWAPESLSPYSTHSTREGVHPMTQVRKRAFGALLFAACATSVVAGTAAAGSHAHTVFHATFKSAISIDAANETITLPLHKGLTAAGKTTWYVVIDSSSKADAAKRGINYAPRLANVRGTKAVQRVS